MESTFQTPDYIVSLLKPTVNKGQSRKAWSIDLETVWLPFFTATNTMGVSSIPLEALGAPLRLAYNADGSVKFGKNGKPVIKIASEISSNIRLIRENFVAGLQSYTHEVYTQNEQGYKETVKASLKAGKPIQDHDKTELDKAMARMVEQAIAEAEAQEQAEAKTVAEAEAKDKAVKAKKELVHT
jgi:hypothetical protein